MKNRAIQIVVILVLVSTTGISTVTLGSDSTRIVRLVETLHMPKNEEKMRRAELDKAIADLVATGDETTVAIMAHCEWNKMNRSFQHRAVGVLKEIGTSKAQEALLDIALGQGPVKGNGSNWAARNYVQTLQNKADARKLLTSKRPDVLCTALLAIEGQPVDANLLGQLKPMLESKRYYLCFGVAAVMGADPEVEYVQEKISAIIKAIETVEQFPDADKPFPNNLAVGSVADHAYFRFSDALSKMKGADAYLLDVSNLVEGKAYWCVVMARARRGDISVKDELYKIIKEPSAGLLRSYAVRSLKHIGNREDLPLLHELAATDSLEVKAPCKKVNALSEEKKQSKIHPVRLAARQVINYIEKKSNN